MPNESYANDEGFPEVQAGYAVEKSKHESTGNGQPDGIKRQGHTGSVRAGEEHCKQFGDKDMSLSYNGTESQSITWNGADVQSVTMDGVEVWSAHPPFLARMRYDANEATHVKDLAGKGYTITTPVANAITAAADPFGGNAALNLSNNNIFYSNALEIKGDVTIAFWAKSDSVRGYQCVLSFQTDESMYAGSRSLGFFGNSVGIHVDHSTGSDAVKGNISNVTSWHYYELSTEGNIARIFVDGVLVNQGTNTLLTQYPLWKKANKLLCIGHYYPNRDGANQFYGCIYDFCIFDGVWHKENYNVPTKYI
jgi:hypothetical protein